MMRAPAVTLKGDDASYGRHTAPVEVYGLPFQKAYTDYIIVQ